MSLHFAAADRQSDRGSAIVEFVLFGIATLMPVTLLLTGIFTLQRASFTAQSAVREATRAFVMSADDSSAFVAAQAAADQAFKDAGMAEHRITITCSESPCTTPSSAVRIAVKFPLTFAIKTWLIQAHHEERVNPWA